MDAVLVWTDVEAKEYRRSRLRYFKDNPGESDDWRQDRGKSEFLLCLGAILRNCPRIRRVSVLSAIKIGLPEEFLDMNFPDRETEVRMMGFDELFADGMEGFLPCLSPIAAVTQLYKARSIDDSFYLFNVGCVPVREMDILKFWKDGESVCYGKWERSDSISGRRKERIFIPGMVPMLMSRRTMEECLTSHPGLLTSNLRHHLDSPRSRFNPHGQTDIRLLMANRRDSVRVDTGRGRRDHGTMVLRLDPCDDRTFFETIEKADGAEFIETAPLKDFDLGQRRAIVDFLCHLLQIRLP